MKQNELLYELLNDNFYYCGTLNYFIGNNPDYIEDTIKFIKDFIEKDYLDFKELNLNKKALNALEDALTALYIDGTETGFKTGFDLAMVMLGAKPVFNVLPDKKRADSKTKQALCD